MCVSINLGDLTKKRKILKQHTTGKRLKYKAYEKKNQLEQDDKLQKGGL